MDDDLIQLSAADRLVYLLWGFVSLVFLCSVWSLILQQPALGFCTQWSKNSEEINLDMFQDVDYIPFVRVPMPDQASSYYVRGLWTKRPLQAPNGKMKDEGFPCF